MMKLRCYQDAIVERLSKLFWAGEPSALVRAPTGSGKTVMAMMFIRMIEDEFKEKYGREMVVFWVTKRRNLLSQGAATADACGIKTTIQYRTMFENRNAFTKADLVVLDEAHSDACSSAQAVYHVCKPMFSLGLSATPFRTDKGLLSFKHTIWESDYRQLIDLSYLSKFVEYYLPEWTPKSVTDLYLSDTKRFGKSVMFFKDRASADEAKELLLAAGIAADTIYSSDGKVHREDAIAKLESGKIKVLINLNILTEGFDCPSLKTVFVKKTGSKSESIQMGGRVLRLWKNMKKNIVQTVEAEYPFSAAVNCPPREKFRVHEDLTLERVDVNEKIEALITSTVDKLNAIASLGSLKL